VEGEKEKLINYFIFSIIVFVLFYTIFSIAVLRLWQKREAQWEREKKSIREDALNKSRSVIKGQISEQLVPFMSGFPYNASDLKFIGNFCDYICISNMSVARDTDEEIKEIVFMDIKSGSSQLSKVQRKIRDAILDGRVEWETVRINDDNSVTVKRAEKSGTSSD